MIDPDELKRFDSCSHLGGLECRLCLTLHTNEGSYLAHTQGKKHQTNLARRAAKEAKDSSTYQAQLIAQANAQRAQVQKKQVRATTSDSVGT